MATTVVQVMVLDAGGDGPQRDPAATLSLEVGEKSSTVIRRSHLAYSVSENRLLGSTHSLALPWVSFCRLWLRSVSQDNASPDEQVQIQLVSVPMYGILTRSQSQQEHQELREYSSFTMEDISALRIRFETLRLHTADLPPFSVCLHCSSCCCAAIKSGVLFIKQVAGETALM